MAQALWKVTFGLLLAGSVVFLGLAGLLATTIRSLDLSIHDKYVAILPSHLLFVAVTLLILTFAVWKLKVLH